MKEDWDAVKRSWLWTDRRPKLKNKPRRHTAKEMRRCCALLTDAVWIRAKASLNDSWTDEWRLERNWKETIVSYSTYYQRIWLEKKKYNRKGNPHSYRGSNEVLLNTRQQVRVEIFSEDVCTGATDGTSCLNFFFFSLTGRRPLQCDQCPPSERQPAQICLPLPSAVSWQPSISDPS